MGKFFLWAIVMIASALPSGTAGAQAVPPSLLACAKETDSLRRLVCYDREIEQLSAARAAAAPTSPVSAAAPRPPAPPAAPSSQAPPLPPVPPASPAPAAAPPPLAAAQTPPSASAPGAVSPPRHIKGRVERVASSGDLLTLYLDNHQVWQQVSQAAAELHIKPGDQISIDREMGTYYLSDRLGIAVRVRLIQPP